MGFLDKAKKLAEQAKDKAEEAIQEVKARTEQARQNQSSGNGGGAAGERDPRWGTPYLPGQFGRPGWRERGLEDPAGVLPIKDRDRLGVPHSTKSQILEEPYGMGRRWTAEGRSAALFYQLYPEHQSWEPPGGKAPYPNVSGATSATLPDGRSLLFIPRSDAAIVLEVSGIDDAGQLDLANAVVSHTS